MQVGGAFFTKRDENLWGFFTDSHPSGGCPLGKQGKRVDGPVGNLGFSKL